MVIAVDEEDAARETMDLIIPGAESEDELTLDQTVDEIEDVVGTPSYDADWFFLFEGGCIVWDFDAEGEMVATVDDDARRAIGFYDLAALRREMAEQGYVTGQE
jgi:hypothetical protein